MRGENKGEKERNKKNKNKNKKEGADRLQRRLS